MSSKSPSGRECVAFAFDNIAGFVDVLEHVKANPNVTAVQLRSALGLSNSQSDRLAYAGVFTGWLDRDRTGVENHQRFAPLTRAQNDPHQGLGFLVSEFNRHVVTEINLRDLANGAVWIDD